MSANYPGADSAPYTLTTIEKFIAWARKSSTWPLTFGLACCTFEFMALVTPRYDVARHGVEVYRASPRQADLLMVNGRLSNKMVPVIRQLYEQMPVPKWVISVGACASSGGVFDNYAIVQGVDQVLPVDMYVPGCPPPPEALMHAVLKLQAVIARGYTGGGVEAWLARQAQGAAASPARGGVRP